MSIIKRSELRGILILALVILILGALLAVSSGKLETWFGITIGGGPRLFDKIVYVSGNELHAMNPDGSGARQLTTGGVVLSDPSVSPNGARVVFVGRAENSNQVYMVRCAGGEPLELTNVTGGKHLPLFSPDGRRLAFISGGTVYVGDQDADNLQPILPTPKQTSQTMIRRDPLPAYDDYAWSPDGKGMGGVMQNAPQGDVLIFLPKLGGDVKQFKMPSARVSINGIAWARKGLILAASADIAGESAIAFIEITEKSARSVANSRTEEFGSVSLSPDGSKVAFVTRPEGKAGDEGIVVKDTDTGQGGILAAGKFDSISFSPAGDKILAVKLGNDGARDVVVVDTETGRLTQLTKNGKSFDPVWSPASAK